MKLANPPMAKVSLKWVLLLLIVHTAQQISQLQGAVKGLTNWMKGVQLNTNPTQSSPKPNFRY